MTKSFFIAGTDTGVGKTRVGCALLHAFAASGKKVVGMKPVAAGCENGLWMDVERLVAASNATASREQVNPYALIPPLSPNIAAEQESTQIDLMVIHQAYIELNNHAEIIIVEGVGGFLVPLNEREDGADLVKTLDLPIILVVGMRLGCLNHALLTAKAIHAEGLHLLGWVANCIDPKMLALEQNIQTLQRRLDCPLLGVLPFDEQVDSNELSGLLHISKLSD